MSSVRDTSLKTYKEINDEGVYDSRMQEVLQAIKDNPLMTGREYAIIILGYEDMNIVRPRISDLARLGYIFELGKRKCSCGGRTSYVWCTLDSVEKNILLQLGFKKINLDLYKYEYNGISLYQDFRKGKRRSYAFDEHSYSIDPKSLDIHKKLKEEINNKLCGVKIKDGKNK